ncbi:uncharacterized protein F5Z01DRAFT_488516 [Emericellopsis atlantica]|uniref:BZIP domain-containing protein n=1 Tax=Emericellopsis atlantica TaxID=2614577 RepID=A0A9P7ZS14_9HYPO|nr:uncharacterized protein F5Z01DRAFT_488516 [Emericellopsis atlantica]KAG9256792.1 hypothetical protein F5Z01DRAFT_488516 [Emericellopsis atlantica]
MVQSDGATAGDGDWVNGLGSGAPRDPQPQWDLDLSLNSNSMSVSHSQLHPHHYHHHQHQHHHYSTASSGGYHVNSAQTDNEASHFQSSHFHSDHYDSHQPLTTSQPQALEPADKEEFRLPKVEPTSPPGRHNNAQSSPQHLHELNTDTIPTWDSMPPPAQAVPIADGQGTSNPRKRSRTDDSVTSVVITATTEDGARPKKRGRPRLAEADNKTYLERRRTQVRVAQQKYRNKKEQSIVDLEQQVREERAQRRALEQEFQHFLSLLQKNDTMLHSPEDVLSSFTALRQRFFYADLDKEKEQDNQSTTSSASGQHQAPHPTAKRHQATLGTISNSSSDRYLGVASAVDGTRSHEGHNISFTTAATSHHPPEAPLYEVIADPTAENASFPQYIPDPSNPGAWIAQTPVPQDQPLQPPQRMQQYPNPSLSTMRMASPRSYASQEGTFGRRLARTTLERGLVLATMSNPPPDRFGAVFGFSLLFESREGIVRRLNDHLRAMNQQTLSYWRYPFTNLGGAGLHYTDQDPSVGGGSHQEPFKPRHMTGLQMGPMEEQVADVRDKYVSNDTKVNFAGFEGDFLDCMEVERYLRDRGIIIPANAEFVYAELNPARFADAQATDTVPVNAVDGDVYAASAAMNYAQDWSAYGATAVLGNGTGPSAPDINGLTPFLCPAVPPKAWVSKDPSNMLFAAKISVPILVEEMVRRCVCLGRTPGVRPKDVDRAIKIASGLFKSVS